MGKGLPGGRRQAGRIDYRTEPRSSLLPWQIATTARVHVRGDDRTQEGPRAVRRTTV
jgi:hypothetical protein